MVDQLVFNIYYLVYKYPVFFIILIGIYLFFFILTLKNTKFKTISRSKILIIIVVAILNLIFVSFIVLNTLENVREIGKLEDKLNHGAEILEKYKLKNLKYPESLIGLESEFKLYNIDSYKYEKYSDGNMILKIRIYDTYSDLCYKSINNEITLENYIY
ncbi:MAG: hypothetical protein JST55_16855 [Bacteroidetes bacterium]|nr:hypothetical protein [Bacteroidota bacterium]